MSRTSISFVALIAATLLVGPAVADTTEDDVKWINQCIADNAEQEELVDQPWTDKSVKLRVSGPFTVEAVQPPEINLGDVIGQFGSEPGEMPGFVVREATLTNEFEVQNIEAFHATQWLW